jgi:hypothetical protein
MSRERRFKRRRIPSTHQKQARLLASLSIVLVLTLFAAALYFINRWLNPAAI